MRRKRDLRLRRRIRGGFEGMTFSGDFWDNMKSMPPAPDTQSTDPSAPNYIAPPSIGTYQPSQEVQDNWKNSEKYGKEQQEKFDREHPGYYDKHDDDTTFTLDDLSGPKPFFDRLGKNLSGERDRYVPPINPIGDDKLKHEESINFQYAFYNIKKRKPNAEELREGITRVREINSRKLMEKLQAIKEIEPERYNNILVEYSKMKYGYYQHINQYEETGKEVMSWFSGARGTLSFMWSLVFAGAIALDPVMMAGLIVGQGAISSWVNSQFMSLFSTSLSQDASLAEALVQNGVILNKK